MCPRCGTALSEAGAGLRCGDCAGVWLAPATFAEMLVEMHDGPGDPVLEERTGDQELPCPECRRPLLFMSLEGVPVDQCERGHGFWFDRDELRDALHAAGRRRPR